MGLTFLDIPYDGQGCDVSYFQCSTEEAVCINNKCSCGDNYFHDVSNDICKPKIAFNGICTEEAVSNSRQCKTNQAICNNNICQCKSGVIYEGSTDSCTLNIFVVLSVVFILIGVGFVFGAIYFCRASIRKLISNYGQDNNSSSDHGYEDLAELDTRVPYVADYITLGQVNTANIPDADETRPTVTDRNLSDEFRLLQEKSPFHPMTVAKASCNCIKNRQENILPFDHSRVKLKSLNGQEGSDYINANFIPGYSLKYEYIATQGPMLVTFDDFWRMIWEQNADTIVMLTKLFENDERMCDEYWPDESETLKFDDMIISLKSEAHFSNYVERVIQVTKQGEVKTIHQFCYMKWSTMECQETSTFLEFLNNVRDYKKPEQSGKVSERPMVVHCSDGIGRTGTFIAVDIVLQNYSNDYVVDISNIVLEMRNYRSNMVKTESQYAFIHRCFSAFNDTVTEKTGNENGAYVDTHT
ncbi:hypothetical protein ACF0H5_008195 [Mactra antiquata]